MEVKIEPAIEGKTTRVIELVGPAGAGKTTIAKALRQIDENILVGEDLALRNPGHLKIFFNHVPTLLPNLFHQYRSSRMYSWDEVKSIVYLLSWPREIEQQLSTSKQIILLDHGPIFKLAKLDAFGPEMSNSEDFENWWQMILQQWAKILDVVIWLDAPDTILQQRINNRNQKHAIKGKSEGETKLFLERYRNSYKQILDKLNCYGETALIRVDASQSSAEIIAEDIFANCNLMS